MSPADGGARVGVLGAGAVGTRLARQLVSSPSVAEVVLREERADRLQAVVASLGERARIDTAPYADRLEVDVVVLAGPPGTQAGLARTHLERGLPVVSTSDEVGDVRALLDLDVAARRAGVPVVVGAAFAPGLSCVLSAHAAALFDHVDEIHVARSGAGGPACARHHHRALGARAVDWRDGEWVERPGGSGRELCWFPDPIGGRDCYRAALADALLLAPAFPGVTRVTSRVAATRRDRLTMRLPMLWPTHDEGGPGAIRVEVRGRVAGRTDAVVYGVLDRPAIAAGAVAAVAALGVVDGTIDVPGARGLATLADPVGFLAELRARGVRAAVFEGVDQVAAPPPVGKSHA